jgi:hypothetical protein
MCLGSFLALGLVDGEELNPDLLGDLDLMYAQVLVVVAAPEEEESMTTLSVGMPNNLRTPLSLANSSRWNAYIEIR